MTLLRQTTATVTTWGAPHFSEDGQAVAQAWRKLLAPDGRLSDDFVQSLAGVDGDFGLALTTESGATLLAVDRFAQQTLCYRVGPGELCFGERADTLANDSEIDPQAIFDYLYFHHIPSPRTIYRGVMRLPPGHYALFENGKLTVAPYWQATFAPDAATQFEPAKAQFLSLLKDSVARQLDGSKPACFLSGGTDSSTVAGMIRAVTGERPAGYSIGFEAEGYDEMAYARLAAKHFGVDHHEYYVTPADLVQSIPTVAGFYDQPFGNSSAVPAYYCARMAQQDGVSKLLAGDGGDELYGGNSRYAKQRVFGWYDAVPAALRHGLLEPLLLNGWAANTPLVKKAASYVRQAKVPLPARAELYNQLVHLGTVDMLTPAFLAQVDEAAPAQHQQAVWDSVGTASQLNTMLAYDWRYTLAESDLPKVRETTRLAGVGVGFPMLDSALLDFSLTLPDDFKLKGMKLRWFFKEALRGFLPDEILTKKKQGFGLPFGVWTTRNEALKTLARDSVEGLVSRGIVQAEFSRRLFEVQLHEHPGYYGEMIWILMMLEQWLRVHAPEFRI